MIDLAAAKQGFEHRDITSLGLVTTENMMADVFTKIMHPKQLLLALSTGRISHPIVSWIVRDESLLSSNENSSQKKKGAECINDNKEKDSYEVT